MATEEQSVLAGELMLGVLEGPERADALRLLVADRDFAAEVERWRERFAHWFAEFPEVEPGPELEARIMAALPGGAANDRGGAVRLWRAVAGLATLAAAALLALLLLGPEQVAPPAPPPVAAAPAPLVAALNPTPDAGDVAEAPFAAVFDGQASTVTLASALDLPAGRIAELWTIAGDGVPRSVGVLSGGASPRITVSAAARARLVPGVTLAVSVEPPGGSPTGSPTGPVIATGALVGV